MPFSQGRVLPRRVGSGSGPRFPYLIRMVRYLTDNFDTWLSLRFPNQEAYRCITTRWLGYAENWSLGRVNLNAASEGLPYPL